MKINGDKLITLTNTTKTTRWGGGHKQLDTMTLSYNFSTEEAQTGKLRVRDLPGQTSDTLSQKSRSWGCSPVVGYSPSMYKTTCSIPNVQKQNKVLSPLLYNI